MTLVLSTPSLLDLASQINQEHDACEQAYRSGLDHARRAGNLLNQVKIQIRHGQWLSWLAENCSISERTAQAYMRVDREWAKLEESATIADLSFRDALTLLSEPEEPTIQVVEAELVSEPPKRSSQQKFAIGQTVQVANPENLYAGEAVQIVDRHGDVHIGKTSKGVEYPFLPAELQATSEPQQSTPLPTPHSPLLTPQLSETENLKAILREVYEIFGEGLPFTLASRIAEAIAL